MFKIFDILQTKKRRSGETKTSDKDNKNLFLNQIVLKNCICARRMIRPQ